MAAENIPIAKGKTEPANELAGSEPSPEFLVEVEELASYGLTRSMMAAYYQRSESAWKELEKAYPSIVDAIGRGKPRQVKRVGAKLMELIDRGNIKAIMFYLESQGGWNKPANGEGGSDGTLPAVSLTVNDPVEAARIYQQIMLGSK